MIHAIIYHATFDEEEKYTGMRAERVPFELLPELFSFRCDCGRQKTVVKVPIRCDECGAWWKSQTQIHAAEGVIVSPSLRKFGDVNDETN